MTRSKTYEQLTFTDDFMFCKILSTDLELTKDLLELILGISISKVELAQSQKELKFTPADHGVRFDVYVEDDDHTVYDIEMQATNKPHIGKRMRYYQGMLDLSMIEAGGNYRDLKKSYIIFICTTKPSFFKVNLPVYTFKSVCREDPSVTLGDEATKKIINADGYLAPLSPALQAFLKFVKDHQPTDDLTRRIEEKVITARASKNWREEFMTFEMKLDEAREEAREEGKAEGIIEGEAKGEANALKMLTLLYQHCKENNRLEDYEKALKDSDFRQALFLEFGIN